MEMSGFGERERDREIQTPNWHNIISDVSLTKSVDKENSHLTNEGIDSTSCWEE